ncbi:uncharacterized protein LACBIDRAFT_296771 [Laccaria bicolor S238N-H82]|uniref:Predicted protein n=1 Tax=Laccaria bicolor (strain S238N-H82 / ATCC MYA-4686) TaxID=486041 RepID=B0DTN0_LACBS|nr:uncharacterized protein LACBIDRAFT_310095 [Laccaria bicolor S238N-H82]XP_001890595.1 uncharacterized protein LACBIDRAFT_296771 [Laccaria bicolor S238N-H82]EDQ98746.1 predicted protein [Laccaria bicolor S238N-H82]EDR02086.1 predicted protein [Laccaria bicolor S238N-H82]|eukprot:XP_001887243.1 predicted protein [Laccaria bicolor S238N-H82]
MCAQQELPKYIPTNHGGHLTTSLTTTMHVESYGHWNEMLESTYVKRLQDIRLGAAQPLTVSDWRNKLKGHKETWELKSMREQ